MRPLIIRKNKLKLQLLFETVFFPFLIFIFSILQIYFNVDIFVLVLWFLFMFTLCQWSIKFALKYWLFLFSSTVMIIGVFLCENLSLVLLELDMDSGYHGSLLLLTFFVWWLIESIKFGDSFWCGIIKTEYFYGFVSPKKVLDVFPVTVTVYLVLISVALFLASRTNVFRVGMDRVVFATNYMVGNWRLLDQLLMAFLPVPFCTYFRGYKKTAFFFASGYLLYMILTGHKFGGLSYVFYFAFPLLVASSENIRTLRKYMYKLIVICACLVGFVCVHNALLYDGIQNYTFLQNRIAQQGQLWWATYPIDRDEDIHYEEFDDETRTFFEIGKTQHEHYNHGIYKVMRRVTPENIFERKMLHGSRYTAGYYSSVYYYFGTFGVLLISSLLGFVFSGFINWYQKSLVDGNIIDSIVSCKLIVWMFSVISMPDFDVLFSFKFFGLFAIWLFFKFGILFFDRQMLLEKSACIK